MSTDIPTGGYRPPHHVPQGRKAPEPFAFVTTNDEKTGIIMDMREEFERLWRNIDAISPLDPRMKALVKTKLEEANMWLNKGVTRG